MKTIKFLTIAALALLTAACSNDDNEFPTPPAVNNDVIVVTGKLAPKDSDTTTRAVANNCDNKITVKWAIDEQLAVIFYTDDAHREMGKATITDVDETTGAATFQFTLQNNTHLEQDPECTIIYPYKAALEDATGLKSYAEFLGSQDGTLNANLDVRLGNGTISDIVGGIGHATATLQVTKQPAPQYAIFKFTLKKDADNIIQSSAFTVRDGDNKLITTVVPNSSYELYVALPQALMGSTYKFTVSDGENRYTKELTNKAPIEQGKFYQTTLVMGNGDNSGVDLSGLTSDYTAADYDVLKGTLKSNVKISIADNATVVLNNVTINGTNENSYGWAGLTCVGNATIILKGTNTVTGFFNSHPGIRVPNGSTLTIKGSNYDVLNASSNGYGAGIGGGNGLYCGNIVIEGGKINATGGAAAAGIGSGGNANCGNITITGDIINARGGEGAVGIGSGSSTNEDTNSCGDITITSTVHEVHSYAGTNAHYCLGAGLGTTCGAITIGSTVYYDGEDWTDGMESVLKETEFNYLPGN